MITLAKLLPMWVMNVFYVASKCDRSARSFYKRNGNILRTRSAYIYYTGSVELITWETHNICTIKTHKKKPEKTETEKLTGNCTRHI